MKILIVEDDPTIVFGLRKFLESSGYNVTAAFSVQEAMYQLSVPFDLYILDIGLPDGDGYEVCLKIREQTQAPVIFLTAHEDETNLLKGFDLGADDYIVKPVRLEELKRRIQAITRRSQFGIYHIGSLTININNASVQINHEDIALSVLEYRLLLILYKYRGEVLSREVLTQELWTDGDYITDNALSVNMKRLREKMGSAVTIETVHGKGYKLSL